MKTHGFASSVRIDRQDRATSPNRHLSSNATPSDAGVQPTSLDLRPTNLLIARLMIPTKANDRIQVQPPRASSMPSPLSELAPATGLARGRLPAKNGPLTRCRFPTWVQSGWHDALAHGVRGNRKTAPGAWLRNEFLGRSPGGADRRWRLIDRDEQGCPSSGSTQKPRSRWQFG